MDWHLIESDEALVHLLAEKNHCDVVFVDTEFMRRNTFYPEVALVQLAFLSSGEPDDTAWLIDPLKIDDPQPLAALLENPAITKVLHSASEDLEVFQRWLGVLPQPLFDTQRAAALLQVGFGLGYRTLVADICAVDLPKGETRSDWLQRPLTDSQCEYAGLDVTWLAHVWCDLNTRCEDENKLDWVLSDGSDAVVALAAATNEFHKRIKSAWKLRPRQLAALMAICNWREHTARERNRPRSWIIDDKTCLRIATDDPRSMTDLRDGLELPAPVVRRHGEELLVLMDAHRDIPEEELPQAMPPPLNSAQREQVKQLKQRVRERAAELAVAPEVLVASKDYELLLREAAGETIIVPVHWEGWRKEVSIMPLRESLQEEGG